MRLIDRLEVKLGRFAIPGLIRYVVIFNALVFVLYKANPRFLSLLELDRDRVLAGEVWRLASYIFIPSVGNPILDWFFIFCYLGFLWIMGEGLESAWGTFKLNVYYIIGMIGTTCVAFFFGGGFNAAMLNTSLLFAFAWFFPEFVIRIFWVLPIQVKYIAWFTAFQLIVGLVTLGNDFRSAVLVSLANFLLYFGKDIYRDARLRNRSARRRAKFEREAQPDADALHTCAVCQCTEITNPEKEFRVARDGNEYCIEHLPPRN